jgi:hypothetical protein
MRKTLPTKGRGRDDLLAELKALKGNDTDWQHGRAPLYVFRGTPAPTRWGATPSSSSSPRTRWAPSAPSPASSAWRTRWSPWGSTCSTRRRGRRARSRPAAPRASSWRSRPAATGTRPAAQGRQHRGNLVMPVTAHPAFDKAAQIMDLEVRRVPHGPDLRADPGDGGGDRRRHDHDRRLGAELPLWRDRSDRRAGRDGAAPRRVAACRCLRRRLFRAVREEDRLPDPRFRLRECRGDVAVGRPAQVRLLPEAGQTVFYRDRRSTRHQALRVRPTGRTGASPPTPFAGTRPAAGSRRPGRRCTSWASRDTARRRGA